MSPDGMVLFVSNKFYYGREELGPTSGWESLWNESLSKFFGEKLVCFHPDAYGPDSDLESDKAFSDLVSKNNFELIVMIFNNGFRWHRSFLGSVGLQTLSTSGAKIVCIWGDAYIPSQRKLIKKLQGYVDLNILTASEAVSKRLSKRLKVFYSFVPIVNYKSSRGNSICDCDVSFGGTLKEGRRSIIDYLTANGVKVHVGGGEGGGTLTRDAYFGLLGHPMSISFSDSKIEPVINARVFEILSQEVLLLQQWGRETAKFLIPYSDFVPWFNRIDLQEKITYYSSHKDEAKLIAKNGHLRFLEYSNELLWNSVLERLSLVGEPINANAMSFSKISWNLISLRRRALGELANWLSCRRWLAYFFDAKFWLAMGQNPFQVLKYLFLKYRNNKRELGRRIRSELLKRFGFHK